MKKLFFILALLTTYNLLLTTYASADTIYTNDGKEIKGIVLEEYKDRVLLSTVDGEKTIMKSDIKELYYDTNEQNLIKLADQARERGDFIKAFVHYDKAFQINPASKAAKDGIVFMQGYLFKKDMAQKEEAVKRHNEFELRGEKSEIKSDEERFNEELKKLRISSGITLITKGGLTEIENATIGSPAYDAGIRNGDVLIAVWGRLVGYLSLREVVELLLEKTSLETKCTIDRAVEVMISENRNLLSSTSDLIGVNLKMELDGLTIAEVKEPSTAQAAGLRQNDIIIDINSNPTRYMPLKRAVEIIKKSKGDKVKLTIRREVVMWGKEGR